MAANYTNLLQLGVDLGLWFVVNKGAAPTLNLFSAIARNRWTYIVSNWFRLYPSFVTIAGGDENLAAALNDFNNAVQSALLGNTQNAFDNNQNFARFYPFLQSINLNTLTLSPDETILKNNELQRVNNFNEQDFRNMVAFLKYYISYTGSYLGHGDAQGSPLFATVTITKQRDATFQDFLQLESMIKLQNLISGIVFDYRQKQAVSPNLLAAANSNIAPGSSVSVSTRYLSSVPVPFQGTLQQMAKQYLGSSTRWYELVTVNQLQPPFVDQNGSKTPLLSPGNPNNITIDGALGEYIPVGSKIAFGSVKVREETRIIERRLDNNDGTLTLFLSGDQDLTKLKLQELAYVRIRKPGTVYDGSFVLIPLSVASPYTNQPTPMTEALQQLDRALLSFGVDIKRDEVTGDILLDSAGNFQLVYGLDAIRQAFYWAIRTTRGEVDWHRTFGVPDAIGAVYMGSTQEAAVFANALTSSVMQDSRFTSVVLQSINVSGNSLSLMFIITIQGSNTPIPLSFIV